METKKDNQNLYGIVLKGRDRRLNQNHFNLADDDDFFGFDHKSEPIPTSPTFTVAFVIAAVWFAWFAYHAVKYIVINGINLG